MMNTSTGSFTKFCNYSLETEFLNSMIEYMQKKMDLSDLPMPAGK